MCKFIIYSVLQSYNNIVIKGKFTGKFKNSY